MSGSLSPATVGSGQQRWRPATSTPSIRWVDRARTAPCPEGCTSPASSAELSGAISAGRRSPAPSRLAPRRPLWAANSMNEFVKRLKQGLRSIGRGHSDPQDGSQANRAVNDRECDVRLRSELDDAPSSLDKRPAPSVPSPSSSTGRTRKAVLSKARRTSGPQNAMSLWAPAPTSRTSLFHDCAASAPAPALTGSTLVPPPQPATIGLRRSPFGLPDGAIPFDTSADAAHAPSPADAAHPFTPDGERIDRLF